MFGLPKAKPLLACLKIIQLQFISSSTLLIFLCSHYFYIAHAKKSLHDADFFILTEKLFSHGQYALEQVFLFLTWTCSLQCHQLAHIALYFNFASHERLHSGSHIKL